MATTLVF